MDFVLWTTFENLPFILKFWMTLRRRKKIIWKSRITFDSIRFDLVFVNWHVPCMTLYSLKKVNFIIRCILFYLHPEHTGKKNDGLTFENNDKFHCKILMISIVENGSFSLSIESWFNFFLNEKENQSYHESLQ